MYKSAIVIAAPPEQVWPVLTDLARWSEWESAITRTEGTIAEGSRIKLWPDVNPNRAFSVRVTELTRHQRMVFVGGMPLGLFRGVRTYTLQADGEGRTRFAMKEEYSGPLAGLITRSIPDLQPSFETFASGLKHEVEARAGTGPQ